MARATQVMDAEMRAGGSLHAAVVKEDLIGRYVLQVSIRDKGDISSVFVVSAEGHDTRSQNRSPCSCSMRSMRDTSIRSTP